MQLPSITQPLGRTNFIVEASEGDLGALVLGNHSLDLYCRSRQGNDVGAAADWRHSRTVPLPNDNLGYNMVGAAEGWVLAPTGLSTALLRAADATTSLLLTEAQETSV